MCVCVYITCKKKHLNTLTTQHLLYFLLRKNAFGLLIFKTRFLNFKCMYMYI